MQVVQVPLTARPQTFNVALASALYTIRLYWLIPGQCWVIDIQTRTGDRLISGIPLVTGTNLLGQFRHIIPGYLFVATDHTSHGTLDPDANPSFTDLGVTGKVYFTTRVD